MKHDCYELTGGLGYTLEELTYLFNISIPFGKLRVIITLATGTSGSAAVVGAWAVGVEVIAMGRDTKALECPKVSEY